MDIIDLGRENDERMARLREALRLGSGFQLVVVQVEPGAQRDEVLRRLAGWSGRDGVPRLGVRRLVPGESPLARLAGDVDGVVVVGLEVDGRNVAQVFEMLAELNWSRDRLPDLVRGPLVLVVSQHTQTAMFAHAPDFYSWRAHSTRIAPWPGEVAAPAPGLVQVRSSQDPGELDAMIAEARLLHPKPAIELARLHAALSAERAMRGQFAEAEAAFDIALASYERADASDELVELLVMRSRFIEARRGRFDDAVSWLDRARRIVGRGASPIVRAKLHFETAVLACDRGDFAVAASELGQARAAVRSLDARNLVEAELVTFDAQFFTLDAMLASRRGELDVAITCMEQARDLYRRIGFPVGEAFALTQLAQFAAAMGLSYEAEHHGLEAVERAEASGSTSSAAHARATVGWIALANDHEALAGEILDPIITVTDPEPKAYLDEARGTLALRRGDLAVAELALRAAIEGYQLWGGRMAVQIARASLELGKLGRQTHDWALARDGFETAMRVGESKQRAVAALGLAEVRFDRGERSDGLVHELAVAIDLLVTAGDLALADTARQRSGEVLLALGRTSEARAALAAAFASFHARGQAEQAAQVQAVIDTLDDSGPGT